MDEAQDTPRNLGDLIRYGTVAAVDRAARRCTIRLDDDFTTGPVPWFAMRAGEGLVLWSPPSVGEQGLLLCQEGDIGHGLFFAGVYSDAVDAPDSQDRWVGLFKDGARFSYDPETHQLEAILPEGGAFNVTAPGGCSITADVSIDGDVSCTGKVTASDDVVGGGKSLKTHKHLGVTAGGGVSGIPQ